MRCRRMTCPRNIWTKSNSTSEGKTEDTSEPARHRDPACDCFLWTSTLHHCPPARNAEECSLMKKTELVRRTCEDKRRHQRRRRTPSRTGVGEWPRGGSSLKPHFLRQERSVAYARRNVSNEAAPVALDDGVSATGVVAEPPRSLPYTEPLRHLSMV